MTIRAVAMAVRVAAARARGANTAGRGDDICRVANNATVFIHVFIVKKNKPTQRRAGSFR